MALRQLTAYAPYAGRADGGYVDLAFGPQFIVCVDLEGTVVRYDAVTCELQAKRAYQPSVVEHSQRLVASQLERLTSPILGLEGGVGGASRLAANARSVFLGGAPWVGRISWSQAAMAWSPPTPQARSR